MRSPAQRKRQEERVKLFATALSNLGIATLVTGFVGPLITGRWGLLPSGVALFAGTGLHLTAQIVLHYVSGDQLEDA